VLDGICEATAALGFVVVGARLLEFETSGFDGGGVDISIELPSILEPHLKSIGHA
jgi:hypothetical protein